MSETADPLPSPLPSSITRERLAALSGRINMTALLRAADLNPNTLLKVINGGQKRELHESEQTDLAPVLRELRDEIDRML